MRRVSIEAGPALLIAVAAVLVKVVFDVQLSESADLPLQIVLILLVGLMLLQRRRPARFASLVILAFVLSGLWQPGFNGIETTRSFFGVHRVAETADGRHRLLIHGTTIHGAAAPVRRRRAGEIAAGTADLLLFRRPDLADH